MSQWAIQKIASAHHRGGFTCGEPSLDEYLKKYARQNAELGVSKTCVVVRPDTPIVLGYYTVCSGSVSLHQAPTDRKGLPKVLLTAHIARLAVDKTVQRTGLGGILLVDAIGRIVATSEEIGIYAITVDALHERAKQYYLRFGFVPIGEGLRLYIPIQTARMLISPKV